MAMGKRDRESQDPIWVKTADLPRSQGHPFYQRLNVILRERGFDDFVERACARFYARTMGRPGLAPGVYFRCLLVGYFEGIGSERGIDWRCSDSLSLRGFLGVPLEKSTPDHSTLSRTRRLIDVETHVEVFGWVLGLLAEHDLVTGKTLGVDATTLEANAAMRSIVRRDGGQSYQDFLTGLARASGIETPTREDLARIDRDRKGKGGNAEWAHPHDPDARITKMKDGRTHLAHKLEHAADMQTGAVLGVTVQPADRGDTASIAHTMLEAMKQLDRVREDPVGGVALADPIVQEAVVDKGYHSNQTLVDLEDIGVRVYASEPRRGRRNWKGKPRERRAVLANRRRIRGTRGRSLLRRRGEVLERPLAHGLETGGLRRVHVRGHANVLKRVLVLFGGVNLSLLMRTLTGRGTPRGLQGAAKAARARPVRLFGALVNAPALRPPREPMIVHPAHHRRLPRSTLSGRAILTSATGC
ncbi:hypothetical protein PHYC_01276 [Phycisphaerales bacterium]|nr:hypothetical protein PHYC_01276 [Phycisphaerales bacterium]